VIPPERCLRCGPLPLGEARLVTVVVVPVGSQAVLGALVLVGHALRRIRERQELETLGSVAENVLELGPRGVMLASTVVELLSQRRPQLIQPQVVLLRCTSPDSAGMVLVCNLVALICQRTFHHMMRGGHELSVLDHHLGAVLIAVVFGSRLRIAGEKENVHNIVSREGCPEALHNTLRSGHCQWISEKNLWTCWLRSAGLDTRRRE